MNKENELAVTKAVEHISQIALGTTITHLQLLTLLDCAEKDGKYRSRLQLLKNNLIQKHGIFLKTLHKIGYELVKNGRQIDMCMGEYLGGIKKLGKAVIKSQYIPLNQLDNADKNIAVEQSQKMANLFGMMNNGFNVNQIGQ